MEERFWQDRWKKNQIGFHKAEANPLLVRNFASLEVSAGATVFVPLCGKSRDVSWLLGQGYSVAGAELSRIAVDQLFVDLGVAPRTTDLGALTRFEAEGILIFQGSIFDLTREALGQVDAVYDRAALVALPVEMRSRYAAHVMELTGCAPQLLVCFEYEQACMDGPPFSVQEEEVLQRYERTYAVRLLERAQGEMLKGICPSMDAVWALEAK
jgi:thiopurine S-methyltransferase